jgi:KEOPS complex subunit Cgi121
MELVAGTPRDVEALLAALDGVATDHGVVAQAFDARYVAGRDHLRRAVEIADRERARGEGIADDPAMEVLLYAAGRRQIDRALAMGARGGEPAVVVLAGDEEGDETAAADTVRAHEAFDAHEVDLGDPTTLREFFEVSDAELAAADGDLAGIVRERVALLVVER